MDMDLPSEDSGLDLPSEDSGRDLLPESDDGEAMCRTPAKCARRTPGVAAGSCDPPPGDLQLPAEVVDAELDDIFDDVQSSPDKHTHKFVQVHRRTGMTMKKRYTGPSSQEVMKSLFRSERPCLTQNVPRLLDGTLQDDVCEILSRASWSTR